MNDLAAVRAAIYLCTALGRRPSRRLTDTLIRVVTGGKSFKHDRIDTLTREVLGENGAAPGTKGAPRGSKGASFPSCGDQNGEDGAAPGTKGRLYIDIDNREGDYVAKATPSPSAKRKRSQPRQVRLDTRSVPERVADDVIAQLRPVIEPVLVGQTWTTWKTRNRKYAVDMARADLTANEIVAAHEDESAQLGEPIRMLSFLQSRLNGQNPRSYGDPFANDPPTREDQLPWLSDLIDAGIVE